MLDNNVNYLKFDFNQIPDLLCFSQFSFYNGNLLGLTTAQPETQWYGCMKRNAQWPLL